MGSTDRTLHTPSHREALLEACSNGDMSKLQELLRIPQGPGQNHTSQPPAPLKSSLTDAMLAKASQNNHPYTVRYILTLLPETETPEETVRWALLSSFIEMYKTLFTYNPNIIHMTIYDGRETQLGEALSLPASPEYIEFLISCGLRPSNDRLDMSELCLACGRWQTRSVELCTDPTPARRLAAAFWSFSDSVKNGLMDVVSWLLAQGADVNDVATNAALFTHPCKGHPWPALHAAVESGQVEVVRLLLDRGADYELLDEKGRTAFAVAEAVWSQQMVAVLESSEAARAMDPIFCLGFFR